MPLFGDRLVHSIDGRRERSRQGSPAVADGLPLGSISPEPRLFAQVGSDAADPANARPAARDGDASISNVPESSAVRIPLGRDLPEGPPGSFWLDFFRENEPSPAAVRSRVRTLSEDERFEHVEALIQAALIHSQSQPWMYEVLAMSMDINGRDRQEIERVALSMADFGPASYDSMVQSATFLNAFERKEASLRLLKQAAEINPDRAEAFIAAIPIAEATRDVEAASWVVPGTLSTVWGEGSEPVRDAAEALARTLVRRLTRAGKEEEAQKLEALVRLAARPDISVKLEWTGESDLDLSVHEPNDSRCHHGATVTPSGGRLLNDGFGPAQPFEQYVCPLGYSGDYLIDVRRAVGFPVGNRAVLTVAVRQPDGSATTTKHILDTSKPIPPIRVSLEEGRRTAPQQVSRVREPRRPRVAVAAEAAPVRAGAVGTAPQIGVISEGVQLQATPVVSPDRRYVRLGLQPWFQNVVDIETFTFIGGAAPQGGNNP